MRVVTLSLAFAVGASFVVPVAASAQEPAAARPARAFDFNGDSFADLAISLNANRLLSADKSSYQQEKNGAGAVQVLYSSADGVSADGDQVWSQDSPGVLGEGYGGEFDSDGEPSTWDADNFGSALASADFNRDGTPIWPSGCQAMSAVQVA